MVLSGLTNWMFKVFLIAVISCFSISCDQEKELVASYTTANTGPYLMKLEHLDLIKSKSSDDLVLRGEVETMILGAKSLLDKTFPSVLDKKHVPPSGDMHDYMSLHRYSYYNPETDSYETYHDGRTNPEIYEYDRDNLDKVTGAVYTLAMAYYYSDDDDKDRFAEKASEIIYDWFLNPDTRMNPNMEFSNYRPGVNSKTGLIDSRDFVRVIEAASILYGNQHWTPDLHYSLKKWFFDFYKWMLEEYPGGAYHPDPYSNVSTWMDVQRIIFLLFTEQEEYINSIYHVHPIEERISDQIEPNGFQHYEATRGGGKAQHYVYFNLSAYTHLFLLRKNQYERVGYDRDWEIVKNCLQNSCKHGGLKAAFDDIALLLVNNHKTTGLFDFNEDFNQCRYLEIFRSAAIVSNNIEYEQVVEHLVNKGCRNPDILLAYPAITDIF